MLQENHVMRCQRNALVTPDKVLHCLANYPFRSFKYTRFNIDRFTVSLVVRTPYNIRITVVEI